MGPRLRPDAPPELPRDLRLLAAQAAPPIRAAVKRLPARVQTFHPSPPTPPVKALRGRKPPRTLLRPVARELSPRQTRPSLWALLHPRIYARRRPILKSVRRLSLSRKPNHPSRQRKRLRSRPRRSRRSTTCKELSCKPSPMATSA